MAVHTPEQTPEGPLPAHVPLPPRDRPMLIFPQWPLVVTATMSQFPSWAAIAGGAEQMIAKAADRAKARLR